MNEGSSDDALTLEILQAIEGDSDITQRRLAARLGVALGLANSYFKRCAKKGLIKVRQAPANRYAYYLTPKGFAEKSRLTARYLRYSFAFYRRAGNDCHQAFAACQDNGWKRVLLCGVSELAEIATLRAGDHGIQLVGNYDPNCQQERFVQMPVLHDLGQAPEYDACLLTDLQTTPVRHAQLVDAIGSTRLIVPALLQPALT
jgi:DNA-binding MarR family transcriptional regulator